MHHRLVGSEPRCLCGPGVSSSVSSGLYTHRRPLRLEFTSSLAQKARRRAWRAVSAACVGRGGSTGRSKGTTGSGGGQGRHSGGVDSYGGPDPAGQPDAVTAGLSASTLQEVVLLDVGGMHCAGCSRRVKRLLEAEDCVTKAGVNLATETALAHVLLPEGTPAMGPERQRLIADIAEQLAQVLNSNGFQAKARKAGASSAATATALAAKQQQRQQRIEAATRKLAVAWLLAGFCLVGHAAHWLPHVPHWLHLLGSPRFHAVASALALAGPGREILQQGWAAGRRGSPDMNSLVSLGALASFSISCVAAAVPALAWHTYFEEPAMLLGFVLVGRALEERAKLQASADMTALQAMVPATARLKVGGGADWRQVPADALSAGDQVVVLPGEPVPVDGCVSSGRSSVDESALTGEAMPVTKLPGAQVTAGTMNCEGSMWVEVQQAGQATFLAHLAQAVEAAQGRAPPVQRLADAVAGRFVYGVMAASAGTAVFWSTLGPRLFPQVLARSAAAGAPSSGVLLALQLACSVLVVACPCALGLAAPTAVLVGTSAAARRGLLIRGGDVLEAAAHVDVVAFDKTGTLTVGKPSIRSVAVQNGAQPGEAAASAQLLAYAAALERHSTHPLAAAVLAAASAAGASSLEVDQGSLVSQPGSGMSATVGGQRVAVGNADWVASCMPQAASPPQLSSHAPQGRTAQTEIHVAVGSTMRGVLVAADALRADAPATVRALQQRGLRVMLVSGDQAPAAQAVAAALGIPAQDVHSAVKPQGKAALVEQLQRQGLHVAMVGDGVNDTTALSTASVGMAMGGGVAAASQAASIVLLGDRLPQVSEALAISSKTLQKIKQNLTWAFAYNLVAIPLAAGALLPSHGIALTPSIAGAMMGFSSLAVMANSMLLHLEAGKTGAATAKAITAAPKKRQRTLLQPSPVHQQPQHEKPAREPQPVSG